MDRIAIALVLPRVRQIIAPLAVGLMLGVMILGTDALLVLAAMVGIIVLVMAFRKPIAVILIVLCFTTGLIPTRYNPYVNILIGHVQISDLMLIGLLLVIFFRLITEKSFAWIKTPLDLPIFLFYGAVIGGFGTAVWRYGIDFSDATYEARMLMYYLIFFAITNLIRSRSQLLRFLYSAHVISLLIAISTIAQSSLVQSTPLKNYWIKPSGEIVRVFHPGVPFVYIGLITLLCYLGICKNERRVWFQWLKILIMGAALFVTLDRNLLIIVTVAGVLIFLMLTKLERSRLTFNIMGIACLLIVLAGVIVLSGVGTKVLDYSVAFLERLEGMFSSDIFESRASLGSRWREIRFAWAKISKHPLFGIGLNNSYRPAFYDGEPEYASTYIHNAYFAIWLKTGLLGLVPFVWFTFVFLWRGFERWRSIEDNLLRSVTLGCSIAFAGMLLSNLVAPSMVEPGSIVVFGVVLGLSELILVQTELVNGEKKAGAYSEPHIAYGQGQRHPFD